MLEILVQKLFEDMHLPPPNYTEDAKGFTIDLKDDLHIFLQSTPPGFTLQAHVADVPQSKREELFSYIMKANFLGQGTGDQIFGADPSENFLTLSRTIAYEVHYTEFKEILENFANYLSYWKSEIRKKQRGV